MTQDTNPKAWRPLRFETALVVWTLAASAPALVVVAILLVWGHYPASAWLIPFALLAFSFTTVWIFRQRMIYALRTLSNLLESLREDNTSLRGTRACRDDILGEVIGSTNRLAAHLQARRISSREAAALLDKVVAEIDMAVFAFDDEQWLSFVNPAGERLLDADKNDLLGRTAKRLELAQWLQGPPAATVQYSFPGGGGPWDIRHRPFRQGGRVHVLLMVTDMSRALREEERKAWRRLIRVLGHEINNSLAPIKSTAATLAKLNKTKPADWREDLASGLNVIGKRAEALARFMQSYTALARLPPPKPQSLELAPLVQRVVALMAAPNISLRPSPAVSILADADQLEQALINLLKNARDAVRESHGVISVGWYVDAHQVLIEVIDAGPGLLNTDNLFVPFFTTKPGGSGIGLALVRQIAEGHGGSIVLVNREGSSGCVARLCLPL